MERCEYLDRFDPCDPTDSPPDEFFLRDLLDLDVCDRLLRPLSDSKSAAIPLGPSAPVTSSNSHSSEDSESFSSRCFLEDDRRLLCLEPRDCASDDLCVVDLAALAASKFLIMSETDAPLADALLLVCSGYRLLSLWCSLR